jgi:hypothetical protein
MSLRVTQTTIRTAEESIARGEIVDAFLLAMLPPEIVNRLLGIATVHKNRDFKDQVSFLIKKRKGLVVEPYVPSALRRKIDDAHRTARAKEKLRRKLGAKFSKRMSKRRPLQGGAPGLVQQ